MTIGRGTPAVIVQARQVHVAFRLSVNVTDRSEEDRGRISHYPNTSGALSVSHRAMPPVAPVVGVKPTASGLATDLCTFSD